MLASLAAKGLRVISREEAAARQKEIGIPLSYLNFV
jgi:hypothetical protein